MSCVQVTSTGDVMISWEEIDDPNGEFVSYEIHHSDDEFGAVDNIITTINNINTTVYTHAGANANTFSACYYIISNSNDGSPQASTNSETICAILLVVVASPDPGMVDLYYSNPYALSSPPNNNMENEIWLEYPVGTWTQIDNVPLDISQYQYEVQHCAVFYNFQIRVQSPQGCSFVSNFSGGNFTDETYPDIPNLSYVTVNETSQNAEINWTASSADDTWGYIIYECTNFGNTPIDTVYSSGTTSYEFLDSQADLLGPEAYTVAAFDSCFNVVLQDTSFINISPTEGFCHQTIFLNPPILQNCQDFVELQWSAYEGWPDGVDHYEIIFTEDGGLEQIAGTTDGNILSFVHPNLSFNVIYRYTIKAYASNLAANSYSNHRDVSLVMDLAPQNTSTATATVVDKNQVDILVRTESVPLNHTFILERKEENDDEFEYINDVETSFTDFMSFSDFDVDTRIFTYDYRIVVMNDCGDTVDISNTGTTMLLTGLTNNFRLVNTIVWNSYEHWDSGVQGYSVYRSQERGVKGEQIATLSPFITFYEDDMTDMLITDGWFCYTVEAHGNASFGLNPGLGNEAQLANQFGLDENSNSNQFCLQLDPKIWIPNAFMVGGANPIFTPTIGFADFNEYRMVIYSRWGDFIFETKDIYTGWDGSKGGTLLPEGIYAYYISIEDGQGNLHENRGTVLLLKAE